MRSTKLHDFAHFPPISSQVSAGQRVFVTLDEASVASSQPEVLGATTKTTCMVCQACIFILWDGATLAALQTCLGCKMMHLRGFDGAWAFPNFAAEFRKNVICNGTAEVQSLVDAAMMMLCC